MDYSKWKRDPNKVKSILSVQSDGSVVTSKSCVIYIPKQFEEKQLANISADVYIVGIFAMVVDNEYFSISLTNAMMGISPTSISTVKFDEDSYLEFYFAPGSVVFTNIKLIRDDSLVYKIFDQIVAKGHVPWYLGYEDMAKLFSSADKFAGVDFNKSHSILEMFAAAIARDTKDRSQYYRHSVKSAVAAAREPPTFIPLRSIVLGTTNTTSKLLGSYWDDGLTSALVNPSEKTEKIEELLRR